jgi:heme oxygenase (mycobilin-producing)
MSMTPAFDSGQPSRGYVVSAVVIVDLPARPQSKDELVATLKTALRDTRAFDGCREASLCTDHEDPAMVSIVERWETLRHYLTYDAWRTETGFMDMLAPMLGGEPGERHLEVVDS